MNSTRRTAISQRKAAQMGAAYTDQWLGTPVVFTTWEGDRRQGTITRFDGLYPVATFADGTWARLDLSIEVINA